MGEDDQGAAKGAQMAPLPHSGAGQGREPKERKIKETRALRVISEQCCV